MSMFKVLFAIVRLAFITSNIVLEYLDTSKDFLS